MNAPAAKVFQCPQCGAGVIVHALGQTISAACGSCGSIIDVANENLEILQKSSQAIRIKPIIPLGQKGKLRGHTWMCIGMMQRADPSYEQFSWREYLLFNPQQGYRWLVEFDGHWSYVVRAKEAPTTSHTKAKLFGKTYRLYNSGKAQVYFVIGEFYWRVRVGETVDAVDYVLPPEMLSLEKSKDEEIWSIGEYTEPEVIQRAFQLNDPMPPRIGVAPNQPSPAGSRSSGVWSWAWSFLLLLTAAQCLVIFWCQNESVMTASYIHSPAAPRTEVTPPFTVKSMSNLEVTLLAPVQNSWLETNVELVNDKTGDSSPIDMGVEYWSGTDSDGAWSEGSTSTRRIISAVPEGTYHLEITPNSEGTPSADASLAASPRPGEMRRETYPDGRLKSEEPLVDGKLEGMAQYYHSNGKLMASIPFRNGAKHGRFTLYREDGTKEQDLSYVNGQLHGTLRWYDQNGNVRDAQEFRNGAFAPTAKTADVTYSISVKRDVATWSNFVWSVLLLLIYPFWAAWRSRSFEMARWANSDFSPYQTE